MLRIVRWDPLTKRAEAVGLDALPASHADLHPDAVLWIDLENPTPEEEEVIFRRFLPVHPLTLEDVTKMRREPGTGPHLPKVEEFPDYLFVIVNPLPAEVCGPDESSANRDREGAGGVEGTHGPGGPGSPPKGAKKFFRLNRKALPQLSAVLTHHVLVTHHDAPLPCVVDGQAYLARHADNLGRGPDYVFHLILDGIVDEYAPVVERLADRLDRLESVMFRDPSPKVLARLLRLKRQVSYLRKTLILEREVLARLIRGEFRLVDVREIVYYRNVYDHLVRYTELIESAREMVSDLMQTHLSATSNRLNQVMKVLTMISTVVLPMTLIAGVYGMNFENLPEKEWKYGYPFALGLMFLTGVVAFVLFRWKKWI